MKDKIQTIVVLLFISGCSNPPTYDIKPAIEFLSISRTLTSQPDSIRFEISFTDGDGDIGFENPDTSDCNQCDSSCYRHSTFNLFVTDDRTGCLVYFVGIPYIPPKGSSDAISGKVEVVIYPVCCISGGQACVPMSGTPLDTIHYKVQIRDNANNFSNLLELPPIVVQCD